jgi:hypothetical protein
VVMDFAMKLGNWKGNEGGGGERDHVTKSGGSMWWCLLISAFRFVFATCHTSVN